MTKSRDRPMCGASRRSSRAHSEWNVESQTPVATSGRSAPRRARASPGGLVGEGDRQHLVRARVAVADEVGDAVRDDAASSRSPRRRGSAADHPVQHGFALFGVELVEEVHGGVVKYSWWASAISGQRPEVRAAVRAGVAAGVTDLRPLIPFAPQSVEHAAAVRDFLREVADRCRADIPEAHRELELRVHFSQRRDSRRVVTQRPSRCARRLPFGDVRGYRHRRATHLRDQAISLFVRKRPETT